MRVNEKCTRNIRWNTNNELIEIMKKEIDNKEFSGIEIERKWTVDPSIVSYIQKHYKLLSRLKVFQGYFEVHPSLRYVSYIDMLKGEIVYRLDYKEDGELSRREIGIPISPETSQFALEKLKNDPKLKEFENNDYMINKEYWIFELDENHHIEISRVDDCMTMIAEIEFSSEEDANNFEFSNDIDQFIRADVTHDKMFYMNEYWRLTRYKQ